LNRFTNTPPLANLAYGASVPADGSLTGVTPSLTTYITTEAIVYSTKSSATASIATATVTSLVTWLPMSTGQSYSASAAASSASNAIISELSSALSGLPAQGGSSSRGPGHSAAVRVMSSGPLLVASFGLVIGVLALA
jgi:hypothetical protein